MELPDDNSRWWLQALLYAALAAVGGLLGHIMRAMDKKEEINYFRALVQALGSGFVGGLVALVCQQMHLSPQWTGVIAGVCGWLGANATIRILEQLVYRKFGLKKEDIDVE